MADNNFSSQAAKQEQTEELQKIDLIHLLNDMLKGLRALWWVPFLLFIIFGVRYYVTAGRGYSPYYQTSGTVYVAMASDSDSYQNQLTADQMMELFPYMMQNGVLTDALTEKMGTETLPGSINASVDQYTNLMTFTVSGTDPEAIHELLLAVIDVYPDILEYMVGPTEFTLFKDMGVPTEPVNSPVSEIMIIKNAIRYAARYFVIGIVLILLYGLTIRSVSSRNEMKQYLNAECLGSLPVIKKKKRTNDTKKQLTVDNNGVPYGFQESVRMIRTHFERAAGNGVKRIAMVTSTVPGEGKTTIAVNLALSLAQSGKKVLLIDGDMRNPSVENALEIEAREGLSEILTGKAKLDDCIRKLPESGLYVISAGNVTNRSTDLLSGKEMQILLASVRMYADYVIVDTPPVMMLGDSIAVGKYTDGCIYVVRSGHARRNMILNGFSQIAENRIGIIGTVLNADSDTVSSYGSSYGKYGSYGHYGKYGKYGSSYGSYYGDSGKKKKK